MVRKRINDIFEQNDKTMAAGFWYLEDGRCFSRKWNWMNHMLELINNEIRLLKGAEKFAEYLNTFIMQEEDEYNGYGGFFREGIDESIMFILDLREFATENRNYFWKGTQNALVQLIKESDNSHEGDIYLFTVLLDMHKRIKKGENPELLNHLSRVEPKTGKKKGPGWI